MSRWLADDLQISLGPDQVGAALVRRSLTLSGMKRRVVEKQRIVNDTQSHTWNWALQEMDAIFSRYAKDRPNVSVVISNHFVHFALVPWSDLISSEEEQLAHARHCFQMTYGNLSSSWALRVSRAPIGAAQLASAVDEPLLKNCREIVKRHSLRLSSVQPYLMSAYNRLSHQIKHADAWFALVEPGSICLARLQEGRWTRLRTARLVGGWAEFSKFMVREAFMGDADMQAEEKVLYVYAPHLGRIQDISGWEIHELPSPLPTNLAYEADNSLVMALSG